MFRTASPFRIPLLLVLLLMPAFSWGMSYRSSSSSSFWVVPATPHSLVEIWEYAEHVAAIEALHHQQKEQANPISVLLHQPQINQQQVQERLLQPRYNNNNNSNSEDVLFLTLELAVWYPGMQGSRMTDQSATAILGVLRDFLCDDAMAKSFVTTVVHGLDHTQSLCRGVDNDEHPLLEADLAVFQPVNATTVLQSNTIDNGTKVTIGSISHADEKEGNVEWTSWEVIYQIVQLGSPASSWTFTTSVLQNELQESVQDTLDRQIEEGIMNERLREYLDSSVASMAVVGQEVESFSESTLLLEIDQDYTNGAKILRSIGIALVVLVVWVFVMLSGTARTRRLNRERDEQIKEEARLRRRQRELQQQQQQQQQQSLLHRNHSMDTETEVVLLETEDDVNRMLFMGRKESIKAMRGSSAYLKSSVVGGLKVTNDL